MKIIGTLAILIEMVATIGILIYSIYAIFQRKDIYEHYEEQSGVTIRVFFNSICSVAMTITAYLAIFFAGMAISLLLAIFTGDVGNALLGALLMSVIAAAFGGITYLICMCMMKRAVNCQIQGATDFRVAKDLYTAGIGSAMTLILKISFCYLIVAWVIVSFIFKISDN